MRISDWSSDVCSSDLSHRGQINRRPPRLRDHRAPAYAVELTMDLNHFYSQHQVALIRASAATDRRARSRHLADAALLCEQIRYQQVSKGAAATRSWRAASVASVATPELPARTAPKQRPPH